MRKIDTLFLAHPFLASRRIVSLLRADGLLVDRKRVQRLMRKMGMQALGPRPRTTKPEPGHKIFPYLLRGLTIDRPNQAWAADITYIPIGRGFLYLAAIIDPALGDRTPMSVRCDGVTGAPGPNAVDLAVHQGSPRQVPAASGASL